MAAYPVTLALLFCKPTVPRVNPVIPCLRVKSSPTSFVLHFGWSGERSAARGINHSALSSVSVEIYLLRRVRPFKRSSPVLLTAGRYSLPKALRRHEGRLPTIRFPQPTESDRVWDFQADNRLLHRFARLHCRGMGDTVRREHTTSGSYYFSEACAWTSDGVYPADPG